MILNLLFDYLETINSSDITIIEYSFEKIVQSETKRIGESIISTITNQFQSRIEGKLPIEFDPTQEKERINQEINQMINAELSHIASTEMMVELKIEIQ